MRISGEGKISKRRNSKEKVQGNWNKNWALKIVPIGSIHIKGKRKERQKAGRRNSEEKKQDELKHRRQGG